MRFGHPRLVLSLTPTQIDAVHVVGKRVRASKRAKLSPAVWEEAWSEGLSPYDVTLSSILRSLNLPKNVRASVLYTSPGAVTEVRSAPSPGDAGVDAARLEMVENISNSGLEHISSAVRLDHNTGANVLVATDRDLNAQAIFAWLLRAGCRLETLMPTRAIALRSVVQDVVSREDDGSVTCYLGERTTVIASGGSGVLQSIRTIDFGFSLLVEALARGIRQDVEEGGTSDACTNHAEARERLFSVGLPTAKSASANNELSRRVMPLLQPVLQRYYIEIKQTIRFGIPELTSQSRSLRLTGPGAAIKGLPDPISQSIDSDVLVDPAWASFDPEEVGGEGSIERDFINDDVPELALVPRIVSEQSAARQVSAGLRTGVLCAALALAGEAGYVYFQRLDGARALRSSEPQLSVVRQYRSQSELAFELAESLGRASTTTVDQLETRPDWFAVLAELSSLSSDAVRFDDIRGFREDSGAYIAIEGEANADGGASDSLRTLIDSLRASPLYEDVQLGSTSLVEQENRIVKRFALRLLPRMFEPPIPRVGDDQTRAEVTP